MFFMRSCDESTLTRKNHTPMNSRGAGAILQRFFNTSSHSNVQYAKPAQNKACATTQPPLNVP
jgi:hypothetical protein